MDMIKCLISSLFILSIFMIGYAFLIYFVSGGMCSLLGIR